VLLFAKRGVNPEDDGRESYNILSDFPFDPNHQSSELHIAPRTGVDA